MIRRVQNSENSEIKKYKNSLVRDNFKFMALRKKNAKEDRLI